ncbi:DUF4437 domain-containing protein [uncultured Litoreibacter sp.]|uniref:cupin domain-containing protein n=1 Tax=uncultured Litoreibacter sp. TaxID=1392394 RepID=UPI0026184943|nr:DUF4437 domain-containing protein [uncultured Litoreibacter sp.]
MRSLTLLLTCLAAPALAADTDIITQPMPALDWATTPEGVAFAPLQGDRFTEDYMAMVRLPAGLVSPPHVKSANMFGVVIEGVMTHAPHGATTQATPLPTGAFYKIPKDLPHVSSCISDTPCVTFLYQDGKFDFLPVTQ